MPSKDEIKRVRIEIYGLVQGVNFRYYTRAKAKELNLVGFVRNNYNGTVEIEAEGKALALNNFIKSIKTGPLLSRIDKVEINWTGIKNDQGFIVL